MNSAGQAAIEMRDEKKGHFRRPFSVLCCAAAVPHRAAAGKPKRVLQGYCGVFCSNGSVMLRRSRLVSTRTSGLASTCTVAGRSRGT